MSYNAGSIEADIQIRLDALERATGELRLFERDFRDRMRGAGQAADRLDDNVRQRMDGVVTSMKRFASAGAIIAGGVMAFNKLKNVTVEYENLNAALITATGSAERAEMEFKNIEDLASTTPFQVEELVSAFVKLKNLGLDPSREALSAYGNVASGMGKSLDQFIEAVADATTAEFERLKDFGIRAKSQGDTIAFTFQKVTTEVANNATAIEEYLKRIGEVEFAGSTARKADTLGGALSNMSDSTGKASRAFAELINFSEHTTDAIKDTTGLINELTDVMRGMKTLSDSGFISDFQKDWEALNQSVAGKAFDVVIGDAFDWTWWALEKTGDAVWDAMQTGVNAVNGYFVPALNDANNLLLDTYDTVKQMQSVFLDPMGGGSGESSAIEKTAEESKKASEAIADLEFRLSLIGKAEEEIELAKILRKVGEVAPETKEQISELVTEIHRMTKEAKENEKALKDNIVSLREFEEVMSGFDLARDFIKRSDFTGGMSEGFDEWIKDATDRFAQGKRLAERTADGMANAFSDLFFDVMRGEFKDLGDYAKMALTSIQRAVADYLAQMAVAGLIDKYGQWKTKTAGSAAIGSAATGSHASGGPVLAGKTYLVGERGPEYFTPPVNGKITPPEKAMGNISVNVVNQTGVPVTADAEIIEAAAGRAVQIILRDARRNGSVTQSMRGSM